MLTQRPQSDVSPPVRAVGYQKWRDLLFLHWRVAPETIQELLPPGVTVNVFDGFAWVGIVAFDMQGVRPWWFPPLPGVSAFHETNVRTYVNVDGRNPGVWFFSLDAANSLAVRVARWRWHLNYFRSKMRIERRGNRIGYSARRLWPGPSQPTYDFVAEIGDVFLPETCSTADTGMGETLEQFLVERYLLYTQRKNGALLRAEVRHVPYPLQTATVASCEQTLTAAAGIAVDGPPEHVIFSPGVDVDILPLEAVSRRL